MSVPRAIGVLLVEDSEDDARLVVRALRASGFEPTWSRVDSAIRLREALHGKPDLVISDSSIPGLDIMQTMNILREVAPDTPVVVVSGTIQEDQAVEAMRAGAADCVSKQDLKHLGAVIVRELARVESAARLRAMEVESQRVARSLHGEVSQLLGSLRLQLAVARSAGARAREQAIARGYAIIDQAASEVRDLALALWPTLLDELGAEPAVLDEPPVPEPDDLTPRQREVLMLIAEGFRTTQIARRLRISVKTVEAHRAQMMLRLGIDSLAGLVRYAIRTGLVSKD